MGSAWVYVRVSTTKGEQELSLEEQERWARSYAVPQGLDVRVFSERASAKSTVGRPVFQTMMAELDGLAPRQRPKLLAVTSLDRLSRDMTDTLVVARTLRTLRVELHSRDQGLIKAETFADRAALVGQSMGGEAENENRSKRMKASWERRRREGKPTSNKVPYGLQLVGERDEEEAKSAVWVRKAFDWYAQGVGAPTIASRFKAGAPPHVVRRSRPDGTPYERVRQPVWEYNRVLKLLRQSRYRGTLVAPAKFDNVQQLLRSKPRWRQTRRFEYFLSGAVRCSTCNRTLHGHSQGGSSTRTLANGEIVKYSQRRTRYYACHVCNFHINAERLEEKFQNDLGRLQADERLLQQWVRNKSGDIDVTSARRELSQLQVRIQPESIEKIRSRTWEPFSAGIITAEQLRSQLDELESRVLADRRRAQEIQELLESRASAKRTSREATALLNNFWRLFDKGTYEQRRQLVGSLQDALGGITVDRNGLLQWSVEQIKTPIRTKTKSGVQPIAA